MASSILLARHGQTEWSKAGRHTGRTDVPLTEDGRRLGERLAGRDFAQGLVSPLGRAVETCRLAGFTEGAETVGDLAEWDYGDYEGLTTDQVRERIPSWTVWTHGVPGGETSTSLSIRTDRVIGTLDAIEGDVLAFAHGHILRILGARWLGLAPTSGGLLALSTASLSELGWERERRVVRLWNDTSHLDRLS